MFLIIQSIINFNHSLLQYGLRYIKVWHYNLIPYKATIVNVS